MCESQLDVEAAQTHVEKVMLQLNPRKTEGEHKMYLGGVIDTMHDLGVISEETRRILYGRFVG